ncbi:MAG: preprotein translocase subunit SecE [Candidatus Omnitrophica bacterium]|nr:preprotein translocase subunit SecE [Candidatus Omnitrophota bacterium]
MNKIKKFVTDVKLEMLKVSWPARNELLNSAIVVLVSVGLLAAVIAAVDLVYTFMIGVIIK